MNPILELRDHEHGMSLFSKMFFVAFSGIALILAGALLGKAGDVARMNYVTGILIAGGWAIYYLGRDQ